MTQHFFIERFLGVALYAALTLYLAFFIAKVSDVKVRTCLNAYKLAISVLAFFFIPSVNSDLYRLWITAETYNQFPFWQMVTELANSTWSSPYGLVYVCAISRVNPHLLPAVTSFLFYSNVFHIVEDYTDKHGTRRDAIAVIVLLFLSRGIYGEVISGIRSMLAFSFVARCMYEETYNARGTFRNVPMYLLAALLHKSSIVAILAWFILKIITGGFSHKLMVNLVSGLCLALLFARYFPNLVERSYNSAIGYLETGGYSYIWELLFNLAYLVLTLYLVYLQSRKVKLSSEGIVARKVLGGFSAVALAGFRSYSIVHRFISFTTFFSTPLLLEVVDRTREEDGRRSLVTALLYVSLVFLFLSGLKGNLNGIRFITL